MPFYKFVIVYFCPSKSFRLYDTRVKLSQSYTHLLSDLLLFRWIIVITKDPLKKKKKKMKDTRSKSTVPKHIVTL